MHVLVNGLAVEVVSGGTVGALLEQLDRPAGPCAVERNGELVPWRDRAETSLAEGDRLEIVTLTGGG